MARALEESSATTTAHPLDPLSGAEMQAAVEILRANGLLSSSGRVIEVSLREPPKDLVRTFTPEIAISREAFVVTREPVKRTSHEFVVSLADRILLDQRNVPGIRPPINLDEYAEFERIVRQDTRFIEALTRRGVSDPDRVLVEPWGIGDHAPPAFADRRVMFSLCFYRAEADDNPYAKPLEGLHAFVDIDAMEVLSIEDLGVVPLAPGNGAYLPAKLAGIRSDLRPIEIGQPEGVSFSVVGWQVSWQKWRFRIGFTQREGLVLHAVEYEDRGRFRSIANRLSLGELVVPYGDPRPGRAWRNAFDVGEYGLGAMTNSLERGCDCLGVIRYFDVDLVNGSGTSYSIAQAICMHEEDYSLLWKHYDATLDHAEVRRSRRLVVSSIVTAGNYEYGFYWYFYQDASIEFEVKLTGVLLTSGIEAGETSDFGTVVAPLTLANNHQHFFGLRLDMAVDGEENSVSEVNTEAVPIGRDNPYGSAFTARQTPLRTEHDAQRLVEPLAARHWLVQNPNVRNGLGQAVAYKLQPHGNILPFAHPDSDVMRRAGFLTRHLWVTPFSPDERFPAGDYPNQHPGGAGLPAWSASNRALENTDVVLWYTLGSHHIPRPEDWPVMPVERVGFALQPVGFFDSNPALDIAPTEVCAMD
jgi:primary-amine oxidase